MRRPDQQRTGDTGARDIDAASGLEARTVFHVVRRCADGSTLLEARPLTGRTNQIRIHLWHLGYPVCGDAVYLPGGRIGSPKTADIGDPPLCLHASAITFTHPRSNERMTFTAPVPVWGDAP